MPTTNKSKYDTQAHYRISKRWQIELEDDWSPDKIDRVYSIVNQLNQKTPIQFTLSIVQPANYKAPSHWSGWKSREDQRKPFLSR